MFTQEIYMLMDGPIFSQLCLVICIISLVHVTFCRNWKQSFLKKYLKKTWLVQSLEHMEQC